ncbi:hypothetical protein DTO280E4_8831 [Paecilomyces variotii]|nr:hypothetical protein DTO280E4_8831 [Paecilomyces variotii]
MECTYVRLYQKREMKTKKLDSVQLESRFDDFTRKGTAVTTLCLEDLNRAYAPWQCNLRQRYISNAELCLTVNEGIITLVKSAFLENQSPWSPAKQV